MLSRVALATWFTLDNTDRCQLIMDEGEIDIAQHFNFALIIFLFELCESLYLFLVVLSLHKQIRLFFAF